MSPRFILFFTAAAVSISPIQQAGAEPQHKKPRSAPALNSTAPSRAGDLNSPSTDFSGVSPELEDPKAELLKPRKKRDPNFD